MPNPVPHPLARQYAHWLATELAEELAMDDPAPMQAFFEGWLHAFRLVYDAFYVSNRPHDLLRVVRQQASRLYNDLMAQLHHTESDVVRINFYLVRGLLLACGYFDRVMSETDPTDMLRVEALMDGHFALLVLSAEDRSKHLEQRALRYRFDHPLVKLYLPILDLN